MVTTMAKLCMAHASRLGLGMEDVYNYELRMNYSFLTSYYLVTFKSYHTIVNAKSKIHLYYKQSYIVYELR